MSVRGKACQQREWMKGRLVAVCCVSFDYSAISLMVGIPVVKVERAWATG